MSVELLEDLPCTEGYLFEGKKIYGQRDAVDSDKVQLLDLKTDKVHVWYRKGHVIFEKTGKTGLKHISFETIQGCESEAKTGICSERYNKEHRKAHYHYCHTYPQHYHGKPVCRFSKTDKSNICWERNNESHTQTYHHYN